MAKFFPPWLAWRTLAGLLILLLAVLLFIGAGVWIGRRYFARLVVQPVPEIVYSFPEGFVHTERVKVPGPIRTVLREIIRERDRFIFITRPPEGLTPAETTQAEAAALRRFLLRMEIPAGTLIPCKALTMAEGGVTCGHGLGFMAEILEPAAGVFVPVVLEGELARPIELRVEAKPEATLVVGPRLPYNLGLVGSVDLPGIASSWIGAEYQNWLGRAGGPIYRAQAGYGLNGWQANLQVIFPLF